MTRMLFIALVMVALVTSYSRGGDVKDNDQSIQGTWLPSAAELGGRKFPDDVRKSMKLVVKDDNYTVTVGTEPDQGTLKLDPSAKPKTMDITGTEGPNKGKRILAIYECSGDTLRVCYDLDGKSRPTEFKTKAGTKLFLVIYKKDDAVEKDLQKLQGNWTVISIEVNGNKVPEDKIGDPKAVFKGERYSIHDFRLSVKIDPTKKPKTINMDGKDGNGNPLTMIGIYELEGDRLKICFAKPGEKERPSTFETKPKSGQSLIHYDRIKEK